MPASVDLEDEFTHDVFAYLDTLRSTGVVNMYGAGEWLEKAFGFDRHTARRFLKAWMNNFKGDE